MEQHLTYLQAVILAAVQGATEFIPVSSSGHLVLFRTWFNFSDSGGLVFDTILHGGSLVALLIYFRKVWKNLIVSLFSSSRTDNPYYRNLLLLLVIATIPIVIAGALLKPILESGEFVRNNVTCGLTMIVTGTLFWFAEIKLKKTTDKSNKPLTISKALFVGCMQIIALIPGASRAGWTTGAGMLCGQKREKAVEFAFLLGLPAIGGAVIFQLRDIITSSKTVFQPGTTILGFIVSCVVSLISIRFCLSYFKKHSLKLFSIYLWLIGVIALLSC